MTPMFKVRVFHGNEREDWALWGACCLGLGLTPHTCEGSPFPLCSRCAHVEDTPQRHHGQNLGHLQGPCLLVSQPRRCEVSSNTDAHSSWASL